MTSEEIERLLKKYKTKQPGEVWDTETQRQYMEEYRTKEKLEILDVLSTTYFRLPEGQRMRARYLVKSLDFPSICGNCSLEQIIIMILVYVKLEYGVEYHIGKFDKLFEEFDITKNKFIMFLIKLNRFHIDKHNPY